MILGLFIGLVIGFLATAIVYWLLTQRLNRLLDALQNAQRQLQQQESEHEVRLRTATDQLQLDYEQQLADKIEHYQDEQILQSELQALEFETRLNVIETAYDRELEMQR
ncbi:MAG: hypothetical protein AAF716_11140 [Cyanobacteria bacterium P01_D01_bin.1]